MLGRGLVMSKGKALRLAAVASLVIVARMRLYLSSPFVIEFADTGLWVLAAAVYWLWNNDAEEREKRVSERLGQIEGAEWTVKGMCPKCNEWIYWHPGHCGVSLESIAHRDDNRAA